MIDYVKVCVVAFIIVLPIIFYAVYVVAHEQTHQEVFRIYGRSSTIHYSPFGQSMTVGDVTNMSEQDRRDVTMAQANVEAIGYQQFPLFAIGMFIAELLLIKMVVEA